jgi:hypothetical protein
LFVFSLSSLNSAQFMAYTLHSSVYFSILDSGGNVSTLLAARLLLKLSNVYATSRGEKKSLTEVLKQIRKIMERPELDIL